MSQQPDLRQIIREEYLKCASDPAHFMKKYCHIQHPQRGRILFNLYPFQEKTLRLFRDNPYSIVLKSRQLGISTLAASYSLWLMLFQKDKTVLCIATKQETAKNIVTKIRFAYQSLPPWLKIKTVEDNRLSLKFKNESRVLAASSAADSARGFSSYLLVMDECAFIENAEEVWTSAQQTMATGGRAILLSTPNGVGNFFHQMWVDAESKKNTFKTIRLKWDKHPERDQSWRDKQTAELGIKRASQECDTEFLSSGNTVVDTAIIEHYRHNKCKQPVEMRGGDHGYWIWEYPDYTRDYIVSADVARGDGGDYSAFHVIDVETMTQVAEYKGLIGTKEYGNMLVTVATDYNNALLIVENANIGWAVLQQIIDRQYPNTFYSSADLQYVDVEKQLTNKINRDEKKMIPGFTNSQKTRPLLISKLESYFRENLVEVRSVRLIDELSVFIWDSNKATAMRGYNDDLVMSLSIGLWVRDTALRLRQQTMELNRSMLGGISRVGASQNVYRPQSLKSQETWQMNVGLTNDKKEDLTWLL